MLFFLFDVIKDTNVPSWLIPQNCGVNCSSNSSNSTAVPTMSPQRIALRKNDNQTIYVKLGTAPYPEFWHYGFAWLGATATVFYCAGIALYLSRRAISPKMWSRTSLQAIIANLMRCSCFYMMMFAVVFASEVMGIGNDGFAHLMALFALAGMCSGHLTAETFAFIFMKKRRTEFYYVLTGLYSFFAIALLETITMPYRRFMQVRLIAFAFTTTVVFVTTCVFRAIYITSKRKGWIVPDETLADVDIDNWDILAEMAAHDDPDDETRLQRRQRLEWRHATHDAILLFVMALGTFSTFPFNMYTRRIDMNPIGALVYIAYHAQGTMLARHQHVTFARRRRQTRPPPKSPNAYYRFERWGYMWVFLRLIFIVIANIWTGDMTMFYQLAVLGFTDGCVLHRFFWRGTGLQLVRRMCGYVAGVTLAVPLGILVYTLRRSISYDNSLGQI